MNEFFQFSDECKTVNIIKNQGINSTVYKITSHHSEYILLFTTEIRCLNIGNVLNYLKNNTKIPAPKCFSFGIKSSSPLNEPYVLMEFMHGVKLKNAEQYFNEEKKKTLAIHLGQILIEFQKCKFTNISGFSNIKNGIPQGILSRFGDHLELFEKNNVSISEKFSSNEFWKLTLLENYFILKQSNNDRIIKIADFCQWFANNVVDKQNKLKDEENFILVHGDLGDDNIFVDPETGKVTAILDWESAFAGPFEYDLCPLKNKLSCSKYSDFIDEVKNSNGFLPRDVSQFVDCSWLTTLAKKLWTFRLYFPPEKEFDEEAKKWLENRISAMEKLILNFKSKYQ